MIHSDRLDHPSARQACAWPRGTSGRDIDIFMPEQAVYFVWRKPIQPGRFRVFQREVKLRTHKGYPISYTLKALPGEYESWEKAQMVAERLNRGELPADVSELEGEEIG
jgi:hypothetical protein